MNGCYPDGTLLRDVAGALYGAIVNCGGGISGSSGTLFKLTPTASGGGEWTFSPIVTSGSNPSQQLNAPMPIW